jgi:beta-lactamase superfamily II metal-dependent hydrolase
MNLTGVVVMADYKVEVELLAVGQGSCNVVKVTDEAELLIYLAILNAGGDKSRSSPPVVDSQEKLLEYMRLRAQTVTYMDVDYFANLMVISHSDHDHYSIMENILRLVNTPKVIETEETVKVVKIPETETCTDKLPLNEDEERDNFACIHYAINNINAEGQMIPQYVYLFQADYECGRDIFRLKTFNNPIVGSPYSEVLCCGTEPFGSDNIGIRHVTCSMINDCTYEVNFFPHLVYTYNEIKYKWTKIIIHSSHEGCFVDHWYTEVIEEDEKMGAVEEQPEISEVTYNHVRINIEAKPFYIEPNIIGILDILERVVACDKEWQVVFESIKIFYGEMKGVINYTGRRYGEDFYVVPMNADQVVENINSYADKENEAADSQTIAFDAVVTSISKERNGKHPATVSTIIGKSRAHSELSGIEVRTPYKPGTKDPILRITLLGVPEGEDAEFYLTNNARITQNDPPDRYFRNFNSIISTVSINERGPRFVFPGDATVHNLYYNMKNSDNYLSGRGSDIFTLPHHGAYTSNKGNKTDEDGAVSNEGIFLKFIKMVNPGAIVISAGYINTHGHPTRFVMDECLKYLRNKVQIGENYVFFNQNNNSKACGAVYGFCLYPFPLYSTITLEYIGSDQYNVITQHFLINFGEQFEFTNDEGVKYGIEVNEQFIDDETFVPSEDSYTVQNVFTNHQIYEFIKERYE